jgi:hypothetical protein
MFSFRIQAIEAEASRCAHSYVIGTGWRATALPKVRTGFEDAHPFREVRILENPDDFFEDAQPFPRCAPKTAHLRGALRLGRVSAPCGWRSRYQ